MNKALIAALAALALAGCGPARPMTESEFRGFCYQGGDNRFQSCDTITVCGDYSAIIETRQPSLGDCLAECQAVYDRQYWSLATGGCSQAAGDARDWCQRYCRTNYQQ